MTIDDYAFSRWAMTCRVRRMMSDVDNVHALGLLATVGSPERIVGHALYAPPGPLHKSDVGGVRLHLSGPRAVAAVALDMANTVRAATGEPPTGFLVQRMAPPGVEMLVGVINDPQFGPTIACGASGALVELLSDVSVRLSPLTRTDAASMLHELRSFPLLHGYRGGAMCDVAALENSCYASAHLPGITHTLPRWTATR
jgi:hypothetical protein